METMRVFIIDEGLKNLIVRLIGEGTYNTNPAIPMSDVMQIISALNNLKPFILKQEMPIPSASNNAQKETSAKTDKPKTNSPSPKKKVLTAKVHLIDEKLRNLTVNLLGAGTFNTVPARDVMQVIGILTHLKSFDLKQDKKETEKKEDKPTDTKKSDSKK